MGASAPELLIVAGEASGDLHAARLLTALRDQRPGLTGFGLGGSELAAAGFERVADSAEISVVGITEVWKILGRAREIFAELLAEVDDRGCRAAILVDFPEFNLRLARELAERGLTVVYYISPQVWAWRQGRVKTIAQVVDRMLVLFPFETDFYRRHGVEAVHVGHPLVDEVPRLPHVWDRAEAAAGPYRIALLPGSRRSELRRLLPILFAAAERVAARIDARFSIVRAPTIDAAELATAIDPCPLPIEVVAADRFRHLAGCHLALCAAGTATLELGLVGTPMVVVHKVSAGSWLLGRLLVDLPHASLVNLILEREVVPELLQWDAHPVKICRAAVDLLADPAAIAATRAALAGLRERIGPPGGSRRAAGEILRLLDQQQA